MAKPITHPFPKNIKIIVRFIHNYLPISIQIESNPEVCIKIYKVFSPNEDGINDFWIIENIHLYPEALVEVYDRLGNRVYRRRNYINSEEIAFNGKIDGSRLNSGTYYYILDLENNDQILRGSLTIVR